jgi:hypothetical protein
MIIKIYNYSKINICGRRFLSNYNIKYGTILHLSIKIQNKFKFITLYLSNFFYLMYETMRFLSFDPLLVFFYAVYLFEESCYIYFCKILKIIIQTLFIIYWFFYIENTISELIHVGIFQRNMSIHWRSINLKRLKYTEIRR